MEFGDGYTGDPGEHLGILGSGGRHRLTRTQTSAKRCNSLNDSSPELGRVLAAAVP